MRRATRKLLLFTDRDIKVLPTTERGVTIIHVSIDVRAAVLIGHAGDDLFPANGPELRVASNLSGPPLYEGGFSQMSLLTKDLRLEAGAFHPHFHH